MPGKGFFDEEDVKPKAGSFFDEEDIGKPAKLPGPASIDAKKLIQPVSRDPTGLSDRFQSQINAGKKVPVGSSAEEIGNMVGNALPLIGGAMGGVAGAGAGSAIKQTLKGVVPGINGDPSLSEVGTDTLTQGVLPAVVGKAMTGGAQRLMGSVARRSPSVTNVLNTETNAAEEAAVAGRNLANQTTRDANVSAAEEMVKPTEFKLPPRENFPRVGINTLGHDLYKSMNGEIPIEKVVNRAFKNVEDLRQFKTLTGDLQGIEQEGLNRVLKGKIDPEKVLRELKGPNAKIYEEAISPGSRQNVEDLMEILKEKIVPETAKILPTDESILSMSRGKLLLAASPVAFAGHVLGIPGVAPLATGTVGAIMLGEGALNLAMRNPTTAKLLIAAAKTPKTAPMASTLNKALMIGLRGATVMVNGENAVIGPKGELQYPQ